MGESLSRLIYLANAAGLLDLNAVVEGVRGLEAKVAEQAREIEVLRQFGNKDCTAMADEYLAEENSGKRAEQKEGN